MNALLKSGLFFARKLLVSVVGLFLWIVPASKDAVAPDMGETAAALLCMFSSFGAAALLAIPLILYATGWLWFVPVVCVSAYLLIGLAMMSVMSDFGYKLNSWV